MTAKFTGDRFFPAIILIRRLATCDGPNTAPIKAADFAKPNMASNGIIWTRIAEDINACRLKAVRSTVKPLRLNAKGSAPATEGIALPSFLR